jgi:hypothetical protein
MDKRDEEACDGQGSGWTIAEADAIGDAGPRHPRPAALAISGAVRSLDRIGVLRHILSGQDAGL